MPEIDASIPLRAKAPDNLTSLKDMLGIASGAQALATGQISQRRQGVALEQEQGSLDSRKAVGAVMSDPQFRDPETGLFDLNRLAPAVYSADPKMYHAKEALAGAAQANNDTITVKKNALGLADTARTLIGSTVGALATDPQVSPDKVKEALGLLKKQAPEAGPMIDVFGRHVDAIVAKNPSALPAYLIQARSQVMPAATQQQMQTPSGIGVGNGQVTRTVNTNPGAGLPIGATIPGTEQQQQLPPTTPTFDAASGTPGYVGPTGAGRAPPPGAPAGAAPGVATLTVLPRPGFVPSGPKLGSEANVAGSVDVVNKDWAATSANAASAPQNIGVLQNIKKYAAGAVTGVTNDRRAFFAGLAGLAGMAPGEIAKTDTDLLAKNSAMLAQQGGNTDLARLITEAANPNAHMTKEAIEAAANQVIAQQKLAIAKQEYLGHFKGDAEHYKDALSAWNSFADPRVLQLPDMTREEKARMKAAMSPSEQKDFGRKIREMQARGIVK